MEAALVGPGITGGEVTVTLDGDGQDDCGTSIAPGATEAVTARFTITTHANRATAYASAATFSIAPRGAENLTGCV